MAKAKKVYICSHCGSNYAKMMGKCFSCGEFNTVQEEVVIKPKSGGMMNLKDIDGVVTPVNSVDAIELTRLKAPLAARGRSSARIPPRASPWVR